MSTTPYSTHNFTLGELLSTAWQLQRGCKTAIWMCFIVFLILFSMPFLFLSHLLNLSATSNITQYLFTMFSIPILWLLFGSFYNGATLVALCRIRNQPFDLVTGFKCLQPYFKVGLSLLIINLAISLIDILLAYLSMAFKGFFTPASNTIIGLIIQLLITSLFTLTPMLIVDQSKGVIESLTQSYKIMLQSGRCLKLLAAMFIITFITLILFVPTIIGLHNNYPGITLLGVAIVVVYAIYALPWILTIRSLVYHYVFDNKAARS